MGDVFFIYFNRFLTAFKPFIPLILSYIRNTIFNEIKFIMFPFEFRFKSSIWNEKCLNTRNYVVPLYFFYRMSLAIQILTFDIRFCKINKIHWLLGIIEINCVKLLTSIEKDARIYNGVVSKCNKLLEIMIYAFVGIFFIKIFKSW